MNKSHTHTKSTFIITASESFGNFFFGFVCNSCHKRRRTAPGYRDSPSYILKGGRRNAFHLRYIVQNHLHSAINTGFADIDHQIVIAWIIPAHARETLAVFIAQLIALL